MDPFRLGVLVGVIAIAALILARALPAIISTLLQFAGYALILFLIWLGLRIILHWPPK